MGEKMKVKIGCKFIVYYGKMKIFYHGGIEGTEIY
jgi:hypothetical protein